jgi:dTDP-L-rhamnose 4-epimerase
LRFFNVYGPRQALSNPYTGVLANFASRLLNNLSPVVFEDGMQQRDFVNVRDVARACRLALQTSVADRVFNIASGQRYSVLEIAQRLGRLLGKEDIEVEITQRYRVGDIRHCFADTTLARESLGYDAGITFEEGLEELSAWLEGQITPAGVGDARQELVSRGLTV